MEEMRLVLIGKTGSGKSLTGNTLLGERKFESSAGAASKSKYCTLRQSRKGNLLLQVVDTPGLFDTDLSNKTTKEELVKCIGLSSPGPHAFLLVIQKDRFSQETQSTVDQLKELFHEDDFLRHTLVVLTRRSELIDPDSDECEDEDEALRNFFKQSPKLADLVRNCGGGIIAIENNATKQQRSQEAERVVEKVKDLIRNNRNQCYSHKVYQIVEQMKEREKSWQQYREELQTQQRKIEELNRRLEENSACNIL